MSKRRWIHKMITVVASCAVIAGCGANTTTNSSAEQEEKVLSVQVSQVVRDDLYTLNEIYAVTAPNADVNVMTKLNGELIRVNVEKNEVVEKGQILATIDYESLAIQVKLEEIAVEQALEQYKNMHTSQASQTQIDQAQRGLEQAKLRLQLARLNLQNADVNSPIGGVVAEVHAKTGEIVSPGAPLFRVVSLDPIKITANLSPSQMLELTDQKQIKVRIPDLGNSYEADITHISQITDNSGLFALEAKVDNPAAEIKPGMTAILLMEKPLVSDGWIVPSEAIVEQAGEAFVFLVKHGRAVRVPVEIIEAQSEVTAVEGDLSVGDDIVIKGQMLLSDQQLVNIVEGAR